MSAIDDAADLARQFEADRRHLRSVAFQLLGSVADADDAVQSAWLKASRADYALIDNPTGWLTTITAREALDQLRARNRRAERPVNDTDELDRLAAAAASFGPSADEDTLLAESVDRALLVVLDRLSPAQRVAFVLHDVFSVPFEAIAGLLDRSPGAAKKLASRARERLQADPTGEPARAARHLEVVDAFLAASRGGDIETLLELLAPDVVRRVDRALVPDGLPTQLRGAREVADETRQFVHRARNGVVLLIDGAPGIVIAPHGRAQVLLHIGLSDDGCASRVRSIELTGQPDLIDRAALALPRAVFQDCLRRIRYQRQGRPAERPAGGTDREHDAR
jgi:RNA polymerase sigma factor (sigma-70 family)